MGSNELWENKGWDVVNQLLSLVIITILAVMVWRALDRIEARTNANADKQNATLEAIRKQLGDDEAWQRLKEPLEKSLQRNR